MQIPSGSWDEINGPVQLQLQVIADAPAHIPDLQNAVATLQFNGTDTLSISITL